MSDVHTTDEQTVTRSAEKEEAAAEETLDGTQTEAPAVEADLDDVGLTRGKDLSDALHGNPLDALNGNPLDGLDELTNPIENMQGHEALGTDPLGATTFKDAFGNDLKDTPGGVDLDKDDRAPDRFSVDDALAGPDALRAADGGGGTPDGFLPGVHLGGGADPTLAAEPGHEGATKVGGGILDFLFGGGDDKPDAGTKPEKPAKPEKKPLPDFDEEQKKKKGGYDNPEGDGPITVADVEAGLEQNEIKQDSIVNPGRNPDGDDTGGGFDTDGDGQVDPIAGGDDGVTDPPQETISSADVQGQLDQFKASGGYLQNFGNPSEGGGTGGGRPTGSGSPPPGGGDGGDGGGTDGGAEGLTFMDAAAMGVQADLAANDFGGNDFAGNDFGAGSDLSAEGWDAAPAGSEDPDGPPEQDPIQT